MAVSDVIINIDLDTGNVIDSAEELRDTLADMMQSVDGRHASLAMSQLINSMRQAIAQSNQLQARLEELETLSLDPTQYTDDLADDIERVQIQIEQCSDRMRLMAQTFVEMGSRGRAGFRDMEISMQRLQLTTQW